jgi:hypothetical protein
MWHFFQNIVQNAPSVSQIMSIPLGAIDTRAMLRGNDQMQRGTEQGFIHAVLLANLPQLVLSVIYSASNRIISTFALSTELSQFSQRRVGLRVSAEPQGAQQSAFFLQLPYRFAIPVMILSGFLHWLCSQSFSLVSILQQIPTPDPDLPGGITYRVNETLTWGYSPQAILILVILIMLAFFVLIGISCLRFPTYMPVAGSCSAVISAMCHPPPEEDGDEAVLKPLMWGVTTEVLESDVRAVEYSFSSMELKEQTDDDLVMMFPVPKDKRRNHGPSITLWDVIIT